MQGRQLSWHCGGETLGLAEGLPKRITEFFAGGCPGAEPSRNETHGQQFGTARASVRGMLWRSRRAVLVAVLALATPSCLSPTLPLPPPSHPDVQGPDINGQVRLSGVVFPHSQAVAINLRTNVIAGQNTDSGSYDFTIGAQVGDGISFFYLTETRSSEPINIIVRAPKP